MQENMLESFWSVWAKHDIFIFYHQRAIWLYNRSVALFNQKFDKLQAEYCSSYICQCSIDAVNEKKG